MNGGSEEKSRAEVKMLLQVGTAWGDRLRDVLGHLQASWAVLAASQGPLAASWAHLGASWGRLRGALGASEGRAEACGGRKKRILDRGRKLEPWAKAGGRPRWRRGAESSTGVARFSTSKESGHIAKSRRSPFFEDLPREIAIQGRNNKRARIEP